MIYLKTFENKMEDDNKNKIFLVDVSGSFIQKLNYLLDKINFYLAEKFTAIICGYEIDVYNEITLKELAQKLNNYAGGPAILQDGIEYIIKNKLEGNILLFTDGMIDLNIQNLRNPIAVLCTDQLPNIKNAKGPVPYSYVGCWVFMKDLESYDFYYPPRDGSMENYLLNRDSHKFGI